MGHVQLWIISLRCVLGSPSVTFRTRAKKTLTLRVIVALALPLWVSSKLIGESGAWSYAKSDDWSHVVVYFHVC